MNNYYVRNLETQKMELYFDRAMYQALPQDVKNDIKSNCLFSNSKKAWISRAKLDNLWRLERVLEKLQLEDGGTVGDKLSFAEQVEREQERAADRQETSEERAAKAEKESQQRYNHAHELGSIIPMGQPILVGHHSENGHRNLLKKIDNNMRKSCEADDKAAYYNNKASNAEKTATGAKFNDAGYLVNRIKECKKNIRTLERRLQGKFYHYDQPKEITETEKQHWDGRMAEETDKLNFFTAKLKELAVIKTVWDKETLAGKTEVLISGRWRGLVRANPTTVSVENSTFPTEELRRKYPLKYNYGEVQDAR